jgi:hypothetical protein
MPEGVPGWNGSVRSRMSHWTYITGVITVSTIGSTTEENEYIVKTTLNHLPVVSGSEQNMQVNVSRSIFAHESDICDEFGQKSNLLDNGWMHIYSGFLLTVDAELRDRHFEETKRSFVKWLCRLSKRLYVSEICVKLYDDLGNRLIISDPEPFSDMQEPAIWIKKMMEDEWWKRLVQ